MKNSTTTTVQNLKVVSKAEQKALSIPTKKGATKVEPTKPTLKAKVKSNGLHQALLVCNKLDKAENFSLSGALNRLKKQIYADPTYKGIDVNLLTNALTFDNLLANVNERTKASQRFTVYSLGLAVNKYLKTALK